MAKKTDTKTHSIKSIKETGMAAFDAEEVVTVSNLNVHQRISAVMSDLTYIQKKGRASYGDKYAFVSHDDVTDALHSCLVKWGLTWTPDITEVKYDAIQTKRGTAMHTQVVVNIHIVNIDDPSDTIVRRFHGNAITNDDKGIGIATTYAIKIGMLKVFCLPSGEADLEDRNEEIGSAPEERESTRREVVAEVSAKDSVVGDLKTMGVPKGSFVAAVSHFANGVGVTVPTDGTTLNEGQWKLIAVKSEEAMTSGLSWSDIKSSMQPVL